jgi:hypothetical protein
VGPTSEVSRDTDEGLAIELKKRRSEPWKEHPMDGENGWRGHAMKDPTV